ncbi:EAL domain-containing protein [Novosphingobium rhizovicinum]|uniref:EAL domain-containing protein n=1 Tax=Novosphingobium rhizovicinum TaxID=3228928 RepID=A0ABV3RED6_9SPHN
MDVSGLPSFVQDSVPLSTLLGYLQTSSDSIVVVDGNRQPIYLNDRAREEMAQYAAQLGEDFLAEVVEGGKGDELTRLCCEAADSGKPVSFEARLDWLDAWYEIQATAIDGNMILRFRNISDRREAEERLRAAEERYRLAANATKDLIWDYDVRAGSIDWSDALRQFGYSLQNLRCEIEWWRQRVHPVDRARVVESLDEALASGRDRWSSRYRFMRADGSYVVVRDGGFVIRDQDGKPLRMVGSITDLTEDHDARQELARTRSLSHSIAAAAQITVHVVEPDGTIMYEHAFDAHNRNDVQLVQSVGQNWFDQLPHESAVAARACVARVFAEKREERLQVRMVAESGVECWLDLTITPISVGVEEPRVMISAFDVTALQQLRQSLRETQLVHQSILEASADWIMILGTRGEIKLINEPGLRMLEISQPELLLEKQWAELWPEGVRQTIGSALSEANDSRSARFTECALTAAGTPKWWDVVLTPMLDDAGRVIRLLAIARDITSARMQAEEIRWASEHDALTSLPNRRSFQSRLQEATAGAATQGAAVGLLLIDLDHFKHVNDSLGHAAGDCLLIGFAERLRECVEPRGIVARVGGDEFAVIVDDIRRPQELAQIGDKILKQMQAPFAYEDRIISAGASIGAALFPDDAASGHELFKSADIALYALKETGRGGLRMFHSHLREEAQLVASQLSLARTVLREASIVPFYQPRIELHSGRILGFEALLRWQHATNGIQEPATILASFREYDIASGLGELMYTSVLRDLARWRAQNVEVGRVSINVAPAEFLRDNYAERLLSTMAAIGIPPHDVEIEVTEHVFFDRGTHYVIRALQKLKDAGVQIALDDFGTGYSSLSHLRDLPVDVVKIDRSFISRALEDPEIGSIVTAVVELARSLSLQVVAEGIETEAQRSYLLSHQCHQGQGYLFHRPMPAGMVAETLRHHAEIIAAGAPTLKI